MSTVESRLRERISVLEEEIALLREALDAQSDPLLELGIPRQHIAVLAVLMRGGAKTRATLDAAMEADRPSQDGRGARHLDQIISRLRLTLALCGVTIRTIHGVGYALDEAGRERVRTICAAGGTASLRSPGIRDAVAARHGAGGRS